MTTKKKITATASAIVLLIILWAAMLFAVYKGAFTTVACGRFDLTPRFDYLMTPGGCAFDTGAECSVILDDSLTNIPFVGITFTSDIDYKWRLNTFSLLPTLSLNDRETISNFLTVNQKDNEHFRRKGIKIILGQNVIRKANWLFSFRKNRAEVLPLSHAPTIPSHALSLPFRDDGLPSVRLKIRQTTLDFELDTGYDDDLSIQDPAALQKICNGLKFSTDTISCTGLFGESTELKHTFDSLTINGTTYREIAIHSAKRNLLGLKFLRRYDTMFLDSAHKRLYLWNDTPQPDDKEVSPDGEDQSGMCKKCTYHSKGE